MHRAADGDHIVADDRIGAELDVPHHGTTSPLTAPST